ncbi:MAG: chlorohydrolase family protein, partial [Anaerolineaceae bacterium]|nr:chlorohydrolase family protein [Anaerolineaceae bacterium]
AYVVGYENGDHVIYKDGEVVFQDDQVLFVGHSYPGDVDQEIDAGNALVGPGFVDLNALADIDNTPLTFDVQEENTSGLSWSEEYIDRGPHDIGSLQDEVFKFRYALTHLLRNGITTALPVTGLQYRAWAETEEEFEQYIDVVDELGLRVYMGPSYRSGVHYRDAAGNPGLHWDEEKGKKGLKGAVQFINTLNQLNNSRIKGLLVPSTIDTCKKDLLEQTRFYSDELDCPIRLHATQSMREFRLIKEWYQKTPVQYLSDIGFLSDKVLIPHGIYVNGYSYEQIEDGPDLDLLRESQAVIVHCPFVISRSGVLFESFSKFNQYGIRLALGTDCYPADLIISMRMGILMGRIAENSQFACSTADMYRAATIGGADALNRPDLGRLTPGAKADVIVIDLDSFHMGQIDDPIRTMVLNGFGSDTRMVFIDGRLVMENGMIPGVDYQDYRKKAQNYFDRLKNSYTERDYQHRGPETLFPSSFPIKTA